MLTKQQKANCRKLARLMDKVQAAQDAGLLTEVGFDMRQWGMRSKCGTTACAGGWATTIFPEIKLVRLDDTNAGIRPTHGDHSGHSALNELFGSTAPFHDHFYSRIGCAVEPKHVAIALRKLATKGMWLS